MQSSVLGKRKLVASKLTHRVEDQELLAPEMRPKVKPKVLDVRAAEVVHS